jgi:hypothetical protein
MKKLLLATSLITMVVPTSALHAAASNKNLTKVLIGDQWAADTSTDLRGRTVCVGTFISGTAMFVPVGSDAPRKVYVENIVGSCAFDDKMAKTISEEGCKMDDMCQITVDLNLTTGYVRTLYNVHQCGDTAVIHGRLECLLLPIIAKADPMPRELQGTWCYASNNGGKGNNRVTKYVKTVGHDRTDVKCANEDWVIIDQKSYEMIESGCRFVNSFVVGTEQSSRVYQVNFRNCGGYGSTWDESWRTYVGADGRLTVRTKITNQKDEG